MSRIPLIAPRRTVVRATAASALALLALAGCTSLAPDYARPMLPVPATLNGTNGPNGSEGTALAPETGPMGWQDFLQEPRLRELVALALQNNRDLRVAVLAIEKARAQYGVEQSNRFPAVGATAAGNRTRTADDLNTSGRSPTSSQYSAQLGFSNYEIDFFGRVKNLNEAALQEFLRTTENRRSVQLSLVAEVANAWLTLDADGRRLQLAQDTLRSRQKSYELTERSHALGAASGLTLAQAQTTVDTARADVAAFTSQVARDRNALALLAGAPVPAALLPDGANPGATASPARAASASASVAPAPSLATPAATLLAVPGDLPSSVLLNRPPNTRCAARMPALARPVPHFSPASPSRRRRAPPAMRCRACLTAATAPGALRHRSACPSLMRAATAPTSRSPKPRATPPWPSTTRPCKPRSARWPMRWQSAPRWPSACRPSNRCRRPR